MSRGTLASKTVGRGKGCDDRSVSKKAVADCSTTRAKAPHRLTSYDEIVGEYRVMRKEGYPDQKWYAAMSLGDAIEHAAAANNAQLKRHPHQSRVTRRAIRAATAILRGLKSRIQACTDFDAMHTLFEEKLGPVEGIGEMYIYDCAQRIGWSLRRHPRRIYLHRGTREGAKAVGVDVKDRKAIEVGELPKDLRVLTASELEDLLCIFKDELKVVRHGR